MQPATWAYIAAIAMVLLGKPLTPSIDAVTGTLAAAHGPLALLAVGLSLNFEPLPERQVSFFYFFCFFTLLFWMMMLVVVYFAR